MPSSVHTNLSFTEEAERVRVISMVVGLMMDACCLASLEDWALGRGVQSVRIKRRNTEARVDIVIDFF